MLGNVDYIPSNWVGEPNVMAKSLDRLPALPIRRAAEAGKRRANAPDSDRNSAARCACDSKHSELVD